MPKKRVPPPTPTPQATRVKRGFLSGENKLYLERNAGKLTVEHMALHLRRPVGQVRKYLEEMGVPTAVASMKVSQNLTSELEDRPEWSELKQQYDEEELKFFKYRYVQYMSQFGRDDVLATEELQIFSLIQLEVMSNQTMRERRLLITQQKSVQATMEAMYVEIDDCQPRSPLVNRLKDEMKVLSAEFTNISEALKNINIRQSSYMMQSKTLLNDLKGTRDQRVKVIEGSKSSFLGFLKALTQEDFRNQKGREMELMKVAMEREQARMTAPHEFIDGATDQPLLTPQTVLSEGAHDE